VGTLVHWRKGAGLFAGGLAASSLVVAGLAAPAMAVAGGPPSVTPASGTPQLAPNGTTEQVRQLVQCGSTMYAVGRFTSISSHGTTYTRDNVFSFSATAPYAVTSWNPDVNGVVNSITFSGSNCADAYIGGKFSQVGGTSVANLAEVDTSTGAVVTGFLHSANGQVETLLGVNNHILAGGYFTSINNSSRHYMASLNPSTGADDGFLALNISGNYSYAPNNGTRIYNQQLSHSGQYDLVEGDFTSVGGLPRQQIFMLNLSGATGTVTPWTSPEWDGSSNAYPYQCATVEPFYLQAASWSPDDSAIYIATTGYHPNGYPTGATPRTGLCDAAAAFPATQGPVTHLWVNYTGCDSLYSTAADGSTAYFGGHERWSQNPNDCDAAGPGAIKAPGMEGLSPTTGLLTYNPTRGRGLGADDMLTTSAGLWIASDNQSNTNNCGLTAAGKPDYGHAGICLLPY
jgi:hypothetical protein